MAQGGGKAVWLVGSSGPGVVVSGCAASTQSRAAVPRSCNHWQVADGQRTEHVFGFVEAVFHHCLSERVSVGVESQEPRRVRVANVVADAAPIDATGITNRAHDRGQRNPWGQTRVARSSQGGRGRGERGSNGGREVVGAAAIGVMRETIPGGRERGGGGGNTPHTYTYTTTPTTRWLAVAAAIQAVHGHVECRPKRVLEAVELSPRPHPCRHATTAVTTTTERVKLWLGESPEVVHFEGAVGGLERSEARVVAREVCERAYGGRSGGEGLRVLVLVRVESGELLIGSGCCCCCCSDAEFG